VDASGPGDPALRSAPEIPARVKWAGRTLSAVVTRAPVLWPALRGPTRSFFERAAPAWDARERDPSLYLAALGAGLLAVSPAPERALDVGTGTGAAALLVAREFPQARVRGLDISEGMIRRARARVGLDPEGRIAFRVGDAARLPWDDESFDLVTQQNMPPFFGEIARVLRPGGHAVIAASWGAATPFYTPGRALLRGFRRRGLEEVDRGEAGPGTYFVARLPA
jgi:SAM-dependent methyltransferase